MRLLSRFARDESGAILSAEAVLLGTGGVLASVIGVNLFTRAANDELRDVAYSFRSLDQSYSVAGHGSSTAWVAGSGYIQRPVDESIAELRREERRLRDRERRVENTDRDPHGPDGSRDAGRGRPDKPMRRGADHEGSSRKNRGAADREAEADRDLSAWELGRDWE